MHRISALLLLAFVAVAATASTANAQGGDRPVTLLRGDVWKLDARPDGSRVCLTYTARGTSVAVPDRVRSYSTRLCGAVPPPSRLRAKVQQAFCTSAPEALFVIAAPETAKVNVRFQRAGRPDVVVPLRRRALPSAVGRGAAFILSRRSSFVEGTVTSYDREGRRLAQSKYGPFALPGCVGPPPEPVASD